jgi:carbon monoxide dehydrogenase subunit G
MKISGSNVVPLPLERTYFMLQDPDTLARSMPGCQSLEKIGEDEYKMKMKMVMAAVSGNFDGTVKIVDRTPEGYRLMVDGNGKIGFMKGEGALIFATHDDGTHVSYEGDVQVGGTIAAVGQRLIDATAKLMIKRFFDKLIKGDVPEVEQT